MKKFEKLTRTQMKNVMGGAIEEPIGGISPDDGYWKCCLTAAPTECSFCVTANSHSPCPQANTFLQKC